MKSITFEVKDIGVESPPAIIPRVEFEQAPLNNLATVKSPKSAAFPNVDIVIKSITFCLVAGCTNPPAKIPRVDEENPGAYSLPTVKSPKSLASPVDAIVM